MPLNRTKLLGAAGWAIGLLLSGTAGATTISFTAAGQTLHTVYDYPAASFPQLDGASLSATIDYTLKTLTSTSATFTIDLSNNSSGAGTNRLVSFGVATITPTLTGVSDSGTDAGSWSETLATNFPGFQSIDFCVWAGKNCSGGSNTGLLPGDSQTFDVILTYAAQTNPISIAFSTPFPTKWQAVGTTGKSWELGTTCINGACGDAPPKQVPEPATLALFGLGLAGVGFMRRRTSS